MMKTKLLPMLLTTVLGLGFGAFATPTAQGQGFGGIFVGGRDFGIGIRIGDRGHDRHRSRRHVHSQACGSVCHPGYWEDVRDRVWVDGGWKTVWRPAEYGYRFDHCGRRISYLIRPACEERIRCEGRWEYTTRRVWHAGYTSYRCGY